MQVKRKTLTMLLVFVLMLMLLPSISLAVSDTQDGLSAELTTDKASYNVGDTIAVTARVTNTNTFSVDNIKVELTMPNGLALKSGNTCVDIGILAAGESRTITLTATATAASPGRDKPGVPQTSDDSSLILWILLLSASVAGFITTLLFRKKFLSKTLSLFLCFVLALSVMAPVAQAATVTKTFTVQETINVNGSNKTITKKITYDWDASAPTPSPGPTPTPTPSPDPTPIPTPTPDPTPTPITYTITMTNDGSGTASANPASATAGTAITITATPNNQTDYQFKQWVVMSGGVTLSSTTANPATFTMPGNAVEIRAEFEMTQAALKAPANAEVAKITGFTAGTNNSGNLVFNPIINGTLDAGATVDFVELKTGANAVSAVALAGSSMTAGGVLSLNTQNTVDAADFTYVGITFTITLNEVTSDPVTLDINALLGANTTAGKLRTDKDKIPTNGSILGDFTFNNVTPPTPNNYYSISPTVTLSTGVEFLPVSGTFIGGGSPGFSASQIFIKADVGGDIQIAFPAIPEDDFNCRWLSNIILTCDGTLYTCSGVDFLVMVFIM